HEALVDVVDERLFERGARRVTDVEVTRLEHETHVERGVDGSAGAAGESEDTRERDGGEDTANARHRSVPSGEACSHGTREVEVAGLLNVVRGIEHECLVGGPGRGERR